MTSLSRKYEDTLSTKARLMDNDYKISESKKLDLLDEVPCGDKYPYMPVHTRRSSWRLGGAALTRGGYN